MAEDGTYPPLDVPKPLADGVWVVDGAPQRVLGLSLPTRMTVLRLADGGLWLHSPTRHTPALQGALEGLGPVRHLVAPNTAHWAHASPWHKAVPDAKLWAAPGVADRARGQGVHLRVTGGTLGDAAPPDWEGQIEHAVFSAPGLVEVAFHHRASRTLVLTDGVQAMPSGELPLATWLFSRVTGSAPRERYAICSRVPLRSASTSSSGACGSGSPGSSPRWARSSSPSVLTPSIRSRASR